MTGSGKTGLGIGILEEAALDHIPVIAIDPKGDMGNIMLNFPESTAEDLEPWMDAAKAKRKGKTIAELAAKEEAEITYLQAYLPAQLDVAALEELVRQAIADSWPRHMDDSAARAEWGWRPAYDLPRMVEDMLQKLAESEVNGNP